MKKTLKNIVCTALAVWFFAAAAGYNAAKYCCDGCAASNIPIAEMDCCGNAAQNSNNFFDLKNITENGCAMLYVKADFPSFESQQKVNFEPKVFDLPTVFAQNDFSAEIFTEKIHLPHSKNPPNLCGRDILARKRTLLI